VIFSLFVAIQGLFWLFVENKWIFALVLFYRGENAD